MGGQTPRPTTQNRILPDVSESVKPQLDYTLDKVGMAQVEMPIRVAFQGRAPFLQAASIDAFVSLNDKGAKGIHMSRLYLILKQYLENEVLGLETVKSILNSFVESQEGLSRSAYVRIAFDLMIERRALRSEEKGWRRYPVALVGSIKEGHFQYELEVEVKYSSTCPCSAALSRQLIQEAFTTEFKVKEGAIEPEQIYSWLGEERALAATPHSQRSSAFIKVKLDPSGDVPEFVDIIDCVEEVLKTPVQGAVKREDEQEFARLNAQNLMFCEDAARKLKHSFEKNIHFLDYVITVEHFESLHPHSAVSSVVKGIKDGYICEI